MSSFYSFILIAATVLLLQSCKKQDAEFIKQPDAANYSSKVASDWMQLTHLIVQSEGKNPPQTSRIYAYAGIGLYETVLPGMQGYQTLQGQISGLVNLPKAETFGQLDYTTAANEVIYQVISKIFGPLKPANIQAIEDLHAKYRNEISSKISSDVLDRSTAFGRSVASAVINRANNDNYAATRSLSYLVPSSSLNPAYWSPTGTALAPLEPYWGKIKCFAMTASSACTISSSIHFDASPGSPFYDQANEVFTTSLNLTEDQKAIAYWWSDGTATTATPPGHWIAIGDHIVKKKNLSLDKAAEMYALLGIGMADAFISCWDAKYNLNLLRPVTFVHNYIPGGSNWRPLLSTPPFPEYPSGHSVASAAAAEILTNLFGNFSFTDSANVYLGYTPRTYNSFTEAANEAAISRLYGGIHYREAIENGLQQGKEVSKVLFQKIKLRR